MKTIFCESSAMYVNFPNKTKQIWTVGLLIEQNGEYRAALKFKEGNKRQEFVGRGQTINEAVDAMDYHGDNEDALRLISKSKGN